jgi:hypothetical protein
VSPRPPLAAVVLRLAAFCGTGGCALLEGSDPVAEQIQPGALRSHPEQRLVSVSEVADLSDPHFGRKNARLGYFEIYRFP